MEKHKILVVEDERLVAKHIETMVKGLGYEIVGVVSTGEDAVRFALETLPDLVLMDIMLRGDMDGIMASRQIWDKAAIPVIYLTAFADGGTLDRAKVTEPFGYLLKPFEERELYTAIEMALYKHRMDMKLKQRERWLSTILTSIGDGVISTDRDQRISFMNSVAETLTGRKKEDCLGKSLGEVLRLVVEKTGRKILISLKKIAHKRPLVPADQSLLLVRDGDRIPVEIGAALILDEKNNVDGSVYVFRDIAQRKQQEQRLKFLAIHDALTELPNRVLFNDRLTLALANANRRGQRLGVLMLDLDRFKRINDTLGHSVGDRLLQSVGERLLKRLRKTDTVSRLGGDEFMVLITEVGGIESANCVVGRIFKAFKRPFDLKDHKVSITASIGVALFPEDGKDVETLTRNSDTAMYAAKEDGRNTVKFFAPTKQEPGSPPGKRKR